MTNIEFLMAVRQRLLYDGQSSLAGAVLDKQDGDPVVKLLDQSYDAMYGRRTKQPADVIELSIAKLVDDGAPLIVTNQEGYGAARWLAQKPLTDLPDPIPRTFVLYIAAAYKERGVYPTLTAALTDIFSNRTFI